MMYRWVSDRTFPSRNGYRPAVSRPGSFRFRKRMFARPRGGGGSQVCDNTPFGICVSRSNAVSAGKGGKALRLIED